MQRGTSGPPRQPHEPCRDRNRLRRVEPETERVFAETLAVLDRAQLDPSKVVVDHLTADLVGPVLARGSFAGLTVQPGKLAAGEVVEIVRRHGPERLLVDSDCANEPTDPLAVAEVARVLEEAGAPAAEIARVTGANAAAFFGIDRGRLRG